MWFDYQKVGAGPNNWANGGQAPTNEAGVASRVVDLNHGSYNVKSTFTGKGCDPAVRLVSGLTV